MSYHPSNSPDINPIEADSLKQAVQLAWDALPQEIIDAHIASMPNRVQAILDAKGGNTPF
ncbi:hypothetical protein BDQ17DRAFT_1430049 [Cyathus striatus]|nr:hypothetical protein BDQ17DRAFT_1430049 [Cyathus striatus]